MLNTYLHFLKQNFEPVLFGWMLTFFSSFGQTFLISLFVPFILIDLSLSKTEFGSYYAIATILASLLLLRFGHVIDDRPVRPFTNKVIILLLVSTLLLAIIWHPYALFISLIGLRLGGQGLMSHISMSVMSRHFNKDRGKALSISTLGFSIGEMIFPLLFGIFITFIGWRFTVAIGTLFLLFFLITIRKFNLEALDLNNPAEVVLTTDRNQEKPFISEITEDEIKPVGKRRFYLNMLKENRFYILALPSFLISFIITGFFFYQYVMADSKGWSLTIYTLLFTGYGAVRLIFSLYGGILNDKYSGIHIFVYHLIPMILGTLSLAFLPGISAAFGFLIMFGVTIGISGVVKPAILAELYGTGRIGQVRSLYTVVMVISTALAPLVFGLLLDLNISFETIAVGSAIALFLTSIHTLRIYSISVTPGQ